VTSASLASPLAAMPDRVLDSSASDGCGILVRMAVEELASTGTTQDVPTARALVQRVLGLLVLVVILALVVSVLPGLHDVRAQFSRANPIWLVATFLCALASTLSYVAALRGTLSRQIPWGGSWNLGMAEQGSNVLLPTGGVGGPALGAIVMRRAGVPTAIANPRSAALFLLTSATSFAAIIVAGTATGIGLLPAGGVAWVGTLLPAGMAAAAVLAVASLGHLPVGEASPTHGFVKRWRRRFGSLLRDGVQQSIALLREHDPLVIFGCIGYLGFDIAAVGCAFQAFGGGGPPIGAFVLAYTLGQVGALIPTPGGLGGTEGGLIGMFVVYGASAAPAAAAVLAYRVFQLGLPALFGLIAFGRIGRRLRDEELTAAVAARFSNDPPL
jgi:uncharacterized membrane protein YbhN (UPF0104 family)